MVFKTLSSLFGTKPKMPVLDADAPERVPTPDTPFFLPTKTGWLAIPTGDQAGVANALNLLDVKATNWASGVAWSSWYSPRHFSELWFPCFVTPPVERWILVRGLWLGDTHSIQSVVEALSRRFGEAYYFMTLKTTEDHSWAFAQDGQLKRLAYFNEGIAKVSVGEPTPAEVELGLGDIDKLNEMRRTSDDEQEDDLLFVDETVVESLADSWTIAPVLIDIGKVKPSGVGLGGIFKV